jgi:cathepsin B
MVKLGLASGLLVGASAATLKVTWSDCGDADTHAKISDLQPTSIQTGKTNKLVGTGTLDEAVNGATFNSVIKADGVQVASCSGDASQDVVCKLPLGVGTITVKAMDFPLAAGPSVVNTEVKMSSLIPASLAKANTHITSVSDTGDKLFCMDVLTAKADSLESIAEEVNAANNGWEAQVPEKFESLEDVKAYLGAFLPGDAEYQEEPEEELATTVEAPASFDAIEQWPQCSVISNVRDQSACGSCWAFGSVSSFESRACISTGKDIKYSPEDTAFCSNAGNGCSGGNSAWGYFKSTGVVTGGDYTDRGTGDSCYPYSLAPCAHHVPATSKYPACPSGEYPSPRCARSCSESGYSKSFSSDKVRASSSKSIRGESAMIQELVQNGPIYVSFTVYGDFPTYKSGVYKHTSGSYLGGHAVTLVGYGELNGEKYWKIKNSWNEQWGNNGHFLIARGTGECGIESGGSAGTVSAATVV